MSDISVPAGPALFHRGNPWVDARRLNVVLTNCFEERVDFHLRFCLASNIFTGIIEDGGSDGSYIENELTRERLALRRNCVYMVPAGLPVIYHNLPNIRYFSWHFTLERFPGVDVFAGQKRWIAEILPETVGRMAAIFDDRDPLRSACAAKAMILDFCIRHWPDFDEKRVRILKNYEPVFAYVQQHADAVTSVGDLARVMKSSQAAFSKRFIRDTGMSPKELLRREIMHRAVTLLSRPDLSVHQAARRLGFSSEFYFSRWFRSHIGVSPTEFRRHIPAQKIT